MIENHYNKPPKWDEGRTMSKLACLLVLISCCVPGSLFANQNNEVQLTYGNNCAHCHESGAAGAPVSGDFEAWKKRVSVGLHGLVASTRKGKGMMPPKGGCVECSDQDLEEIIKFMLTKKREAL